MTCKQTFTLKAFEGIICTVKSVIERVKGDGSTIYL